MGISTISSIVNETMEVLWVKLQPLHMPIPTKDNFLKIAQRFYDKWHIPHCLGAVDGRHIRIKKPAKSGSLYYNYKKFYSIVLQAVIDADYKYLFIDLGNYGQHSDGGTLRSSSFYKALKLELLKIPKPSAVPNSSIVLPYFFITDGAYQLNQNFLKPYPKKNSSLQKKIYNRNLSRARVVVENGFGFTSQVFRIYYTTIDKPPSVVDSIVKTTCVLHNMLIDKNQKNVFKDMNYRNIDVTDTLVPLQSDEIEHENESGKIVREKLINYFLQNKNSVS